MELKELTMTLCSLSGPSGFEDGVREYIASYMHPFADEVKTDVMGNVLAVRRCGKPGAKTLLLDAHMDEIGLVVTAAEDGFLRFAALGGVDPRMLPAREVRVLGERELFGVIDTMPPHALKAEDMEKSIPLDKLRIDVGLTQEEAEHIAPPGTPVVFSAGCAELGADAICGKSLDDRSCAAILMKAFEELSQKELSVDLYLMLSAQEEVGCRGAGVGAWSVEPDYAVVSDVTFAKTPDSKEVTTEAGKGAAVGIGPNMNRAMTKELFRIAQERGIPCQPEVCPGGHSGTNASAVQVSRAGVATALVSLPIKYMHTPIETARLDDMDSVLRLIVAYAEELEG